MGLGELNIALFGTDGVPGRLLPINFSSCDPTGDAAKGIG